MQVFDDWRSLAHWALGLAAGLAGDALAVAATIAFLAYELLEALAQQVECDSVWCIRNAWLSAAGDTLEYLAGIAGATIGRILYPILAITVL